MSKLEQQIARRRTFAIISHPDAGKTTLTEKLLLFGGAINQAGAVKARGDRRRARSDWMKVEQERGISVTASVMTFDHDGCTYNLLDTPGHEDFSEDTYRTLTAVDSAVMVLDAAKGIEAQTRKLFEVCRNRDMPIITFINKMDREAKDCFELLDEIEQTLQLEVSPASWPIGMGDRFRGCYDLRKDRLVLMNKGKGDRIQDGLVCDGLSDALIDETLGAEVAATLREEVEMARGLCPAFNLESYREGNLTPVFFGSALNNFGVHELVKGLATMAPPPQPQPAIDKDGERDVLPTDEEVSGFVFKIQANMDPRHRDRIAFFRVVSGHFRRGAKLRHTRTEKVMSIHNPVMFLARDREIAQEAWPGDIIGIPNHGNLSIGDTLTERSDIRYRGIPSFAPEVLRSVRPEDPMKAKHLSRALIQLAEEGAAKVFRPTVGSTYIVGVVGALQYEVLAARIETEYNLKVHFESTSLITARWVKGDDPKEIRRFVDAYRGESGTDHKGDVVLLARNAWHLDRAAQDFPNLVFRTTKELTL